MAACGECDSSSDPAWDGTLHHIGSGCVWWAADADFDGAQFIQLYVTLAAQRASKILGIFARLDARDGKPQYLRHMPRIWGYLQRSLAHPALAPLNDWYAEHVPALQD